jgi:hypothetical protein
MTYCGVIVAAVNLERVWIRWARTRLCRLFVLRATVYRLRHGACDRCTLWQAVVLESSNDEKKTKMNKARDVKAGEVKAGAYHHRPGGEVKLAVWGRMSDDRVANEPHDPKLVVLKCLECVTGVVAKLRSNSTMRNLVLSPRLEIVLHNQQIGLIAFDDQRLIRYEAGHKI